METEHDVAPVTLEAFERYATTVGAQVLAASGESEAAAAIAQIASGVVRCSAGVRDRYPGVVRALEEAGTGVHAAEEIGDEEQDRSALAAALAGGTSLVLARGGIAETGSLVLADDALVPRLISMLADTCIALLPAREIVRGLEEAGALVAQLERDGHRYVSLVTGPSRTADIERELTIGVQGPKALYIVVLTGEAA